MGEWWPEGDLLQRLLWRWELSHEANLDFCSLCSVLSLSFQKPTMFSGPKWKTQKTGIPGFNGELYARLFVVLHTVQDCPEHKGPGRPAPHQFHQAGKHRDIRILAPNNIPQASFQLAYFYVKRKYLPGSHANLERISKVGAKPDPEAELCLAATALCKNRQDSTRPPPPGSLREEWGTP